jgi:hypothetical protein
MKKAFWDSLEFLGDKPWIIWGILIPVGTIIFWTAVYQTVKFLL